MNAPTPITLKTLKNRGFSLVITLSLMSDPAKTVVLVGIHSVGSATGSTERYVAVPLVEVLGKDSAKPIARFAWWVGDEGVKARINIDKTLDDKTNYAALTEPRPRPKLPLGMYSRISMIAPSRSKAARSS